MFIDVVEDWPDLIVFVIVGHSVVCVVEAAENSFKLVLTERRSIIVFDFCLVVISSIGTFILTPNFHFARVFGKLFGLISN